MIKLNNEEVFHLRQWLDVPLHGELCRQRNHFIDIITEQLKEISDNRIELLKELADKNKDGMAIIEEGNYKMSPENRKSFMDKYVNSMKNGFVEYEETPRNKKIFKTMKEILLTKMTKGMDIEEGKIYDKFLTELESI